MESTTATPASVRQAMAMVVMDQAMVAMVATERAMATDQVTDLDTVQVTDLVMAPAMAATDQAMAQATAHLDMVAMEIATATVHPAMEATTLAMVLATATMAAGEWRNHWSYLVQSDEVPHLVIVYQKRL